MIGHCLGLRIVVKDRDTRNISAMIEKYLPQAIALSMISAYLLASICAIKPINKEKFRRQFKILLAILLLMIVILFIIPNNPDTFYREYMCIVIIFMAGSIFHISARRYLEIGGSRWNCFVPYLHFSEFIRLWWEDPPDVSNTPSE